MNESSFPSDSVSPLLLLSQADNGDEKQTRNRCFAMAQEQLMVLKDGLEEYSMLLKVAQHSIRAGRRQGWATSQPPAASELLQPQTTDYGWRAVYLSLSVSSEALPTPRHARDKPLARWGEKCFCTVTS